MLELNKIHCIEIREALRQIPDESIDCVMTSPPYWALRDYGSEPQIWDENSECEHKWGKELVFAGQRAGNKEITGKEQSFLKNNIQFGTNKGSGNFCLNCNAWKGELGLEPTFDLYIKHLCDIFDEIKRVLKKTGTCWVNLGDTYNSGSGGYDDKYIKDGSVIENRTITKDIVQFKRGSITGLQPKSLCQIPSRFAIEMSNRGWILRNEIIWFKPNCMPSSAKDRFTVDFEKLFFFTKSKKYYFEQQFEPHQSDTFTGRIIGGIESYSEAKKNGVRTGTRMGNNSSGRNKRCVWEICPQPFPDAHFAVFPEKLVETPIKAGCPKKGVVLDPFCGSGTTCVVAKKLGRDFIGIDIQPKYVEIAKKRVSKVPIRLDRLLL